MKDIFEEKSTSTHIKPVEQETEADLYEFMQYVYFNFLSEAFVAKILQCEEMFHIGIRSDVINNTIELVLQAGDTHIASLGIIPFADVYSKDCEQLAIYAESVSIIAGDLAYGEEDNPIRKSTLHLCEQIRTAYEIIQINERYAVNGYRS